MGKPINTEEYVQVTLPIIIIILGLFGNILSCVVLLRKNFRYCIPRFYYLAICVLDSIFLLSSFPLIVAIRILFGTDYPAFSKIGCATSNFMIRASRTTSAWVLVVLTVERMLMITLSRQAQKYTSQRRAAIGTLIGIISAGAMSVYCIFLFDLQPLYDSCKWHTDVYGERISYRIFTFDLIFCFLIPCTIMSTSDSVLVLFLYNSRKIQPQTENCRIAVTIITLSVSTFLLCAPNWVSIIVFMSNDKMEFPAHLGTILHSLDILTYSVKCLLYSVTIPDFRLEIREMFRCCCRKNNSLHSQQNISEDMQLALITEST